ncbi:hypothetical protein ABT297_01390 [Dactylosporangium sp. NPDC000555]|uniref:hypothetical protein n=1 Tax=Dactylosporangium sp. NPDC000555 TaxID=3154260 RepID=UPI003323C498
MSTPRLPCPLAERCESCDDPTDLDVYEAKTLVGLICLTLCRICVEDECTPPLDAPGAVHRALIHREHLTATPNGD